MLLTKSGYIIPSFHELFYWYLFVLVPLSLISFIVLFTLFNRLFHGKIKPAVVSTFVTNWFIITFFSFFNSWSTLSFLEKLMDTLVGSFFVKSLLIPVDIIGIIIWRGLLRKSKILILILGIIIILFIFFYPKKYEYYKITSNEGIFHINEAIHRSRYSWLSQDIRYDDHIQCACFGYKVPITFGLSPINYHLCYGVAHSCISERIDYCPALPIGEYCEFTIYGDL